ncbi:hypothetical protein D3093_00810 [Azospirillum argentinense]|uniref:Uncharacterized protein n=1 Tax=Azospirillum argentinense TaxID=2970906 RepID=A0A4D8P9S5_9PROT|nr:hypothetical protein [Azospirillum argentinense]QCN93930.1 hypothetical protein D3093_00810 [Azospirillum argentinense]
MIFRSIPGLLTALLVFTAAPARSDPCLDIPSVLRSADPALNTTLGGHLTRHIFGAPPPPNAAQEVGMPLFADLWAWRAAWNTVTGYPGEFLCGEELGGTQFGKTLSVQVPALWCGETDDIGRCTGATPFTSTTVTYVFERAGPPDAPVWILGVAYPKP